MALTYFTIAEFRSLPDMDSTARYPDAKLTAAGEWIESVIEREVGTSFAARSRTETLNGDDQCDGGLKLATPYVLSVTAVTSNGVVFGVPELAEVSVRDGIAFRRPAGTYVGFTAWDYGFRNIVITYNGGYSATPPSDVKDAALQAARYRVIRTTTGGGLTDRAISTSNEMGTTQLAIAGMNRPTGLPDVDSVICGWRDKLNLFGFG
ncbi:MAG TPA: hypothetical protein VEX15_18405 [Nocardioidaceae bacterium]|nr:hypothetical protein [Nocardioidaceae bacterium]